MRVIILTFILILVPVTMTKNIESNNLIRAGKCIIPIGLLGPEAKSTTRRKYLFVNECFGRNLALECSYLYGNEQYFWRKNGELIKESEYVKIIKNNGRKGTTLHLKDVDFWTVGTYTCHCEATSCEPLEFHLKATPIMRKEIREETQDTDYLSYED